MKQSITKTTKLDIHAERWVTYRRRYELLVDENGYIKYGVYTHMDGSRQTVYPYMLSPYKTEWIRASFNYKNLYKSNGHYRMR